MSAVLVGCGNIGTSSAGSSPPVVSEPASSSSASSSAAEKTEQILPFRLSNYDCQVTIPIAWNSICKTELYDDGTGITFSSVNNLRFGGVAFAIVAVTDDQLSAGHAFDFCDDSPVQIGRDSEHHVSFYRTHPYTDVEYNPSDSSAASEYISLLDGEEAVGQSFTFAYHSSTHDAASSSASADDNSTGNWSGAYQELLTRAISAYPDHANTCNYTVYDADHDGTPELFLKTGTCEADFLYHIYTYSGGAQLLGQIAGGHSSICGFSGQDGFIVQYGQMGYEEIDVYRMTNHTIPDSPEVAFEGAVEEYHNLTALSAYELDDASGLNWTANPSENNQAILDAL
jgi:hypothetical protein